MPGSLKGDDEADFVEQLRTEIRRRLAERGIPQLRLAEHTGVSEAYMSKWLAGDTTGTPALIERLAEGVGLRIAFQDTGAAPDLGGRKSPSEIRTVAEVAALIEADIRSGVYLPGTQLPFVVKLAELYGTRPRHAGAALARLSAKGLIRRHHNGGSSVLLRTKILVSLSPDNTVAGGSEDRDIIASMKIIAEIPDEAAEAVSAVLAWLESRAHKAPGEVLIIAAGEDTADRPLFVRLLGLDVSLERKKPEYHCSACGGVCGTRGNPKRTWTGPAGSKYYCKRTCSPGSMRR